MAELLPLFFIGFIAAATLGPDILLLVRTAIFRGVGVSFNVLFGILTGNILMLLVVYLGLGYIGDNHLFKTVVQSVGGIYLLYLAILIYIYRNDPIEVKNEKAKAGFKEGLVVNLSNPKAILFFAVVITPFLNGEFLALKISSLGFGIFSVFILAILLADRLKAKVLSPKVIEKIDMIAAAVFVLFALTMIGDVIL